VGKDEQACLQALLAGLSPIEPTEKPVFPTGGPSKSPAFPPSKPPSTAIPHNLPTLQPFFGREEELAKIARALDPDERTWGALIDGPGGMGKTSLAARAAYACTPEQFERIVFVSLKSRELDDDGVRDLSGFLISGIKELFNELARELGRDDIAKVVEDQRPRLLLDALRGMKTLLVLDNLESLLKPERDTIFTFVKKLPHGCKAILTSRVRLGSGAEELILEKLGQDAALKTLAKLAETNSVLAKTSEAERIVLYRETAGKPLLLRWTAGQIGRGSCLTFTDAIAYLRSCPKGNDPLEFIFGDLVEDFSEAETRTLCALTCFTLLAKVEHIATVAGVARFSRVETEFSPTDSIMESRATTQQIETALKSLTNRSLVVPSEEFQTFTLVPLVADFLRVKKPDVMRETGDRLEKHAYALVMENGYRKHDCFPLLDAAWPLVTAALPRFLTGPNDPVQAICAALQFFLNFTGRWDERLALCREAEKYAMAAGDFVNAGWRACQAGWVHHRRGQSSELLACADRADSYWRRVEVGALERATALHLRGHVHRVARDYPTALGAYRQAVELYRSLGNETMEVARGLNALANGERVIGDMDAAERDFAEALRIAQVVDDREGVAYMTGNLAAVALDRRDWFSAENLSRRALPLAEKIGRLELIADDCCRLALALVRQGKSGEALTHARRAVDIFKKLYSPNLAVAQATLIECRRADSFARLNHGWIYNTTTLEGNMLSLTEVEQALKDPAAIFAHRPAEHVAATRAQGEALKLLADYLQADQDWTTDELFRLHTVLMQGSTVDSFKPIGAWKIEDNGTPVKLDGKNVWNDAYAAANHVRRLMDTWLAELNRRRQGDKEPFDDHVWLHATFVRIHPFADGNGRMARLLANLPLLSAGLDPVDIPATARDRYLSALASWQIACGPPSPNEPLFEKPELLEDFRVLCSSSRTSAD
jgi:tetratricopeptide (TPR) repeat protein